MAARPVRVQDRLGACGVALLCVDRGTGHVGDHCVSSAPWVLGVAQGVILGRGLGEPDITAISAEVAVLEGIGNVLLDDDGATGGVDEPRALLHLGDEVLVEQTAGLLVERAVDGDNVTLCEHLLEVLNAAAANLLLDLGAQGLVVEVEELLAVEGLETAEHTLTNTADSDGTNDLVLEVVLVLSDLSDVPVTAGDLLVGGDEVADESEDGHDNVLSDGDNVGAGDLSDGDTAVGLVGGIEVDVVRADTSSDGELQVLGLSETLCCEVTGVETVGMSALSSIAMWLRAKTSSSRTEAGRSSGDAGQFSKHVRCGDDDFGVNEVLVELRVLTLLVGGSDELVTLLLNPLPQTKLVLGGTEKAGLLLSVDATLRCC